MVSICANRIFKPVKNGVKNGFYLLTAREPAAVLPRDNQLAIEDNPENTTSITDPTNQPSVDEKKLRKFTHIFCAFRQFIILAWKRAKNLVISIGEGISNLISKINL